MDEGMLGFIMLFAGNFAPLKWALCDGSLLPISLNANLFSLIGTTYGGDGKKTFALPDLRGRAILGAGQGMSLYKPGDQGGINSVAPLSTKTIPAHTHPITMTIKPKAAGIADQATPRGAVYAGNANQLYNYSADIKLAAYKATITTSTTGNATSNSLFVQHPVLALNYIICIKGVFPPRNN
jgi:microcystin-dependent protein